MLKITQTEVQGSMEWMRNEFENGETEGSAGGCTWQGTEAGRRRMQGCISDMEEELAGWIEVQELARHSHQCP